MGREIRKVPAGWEHPTDEKGKYKPMLEESYIEALQDWLANHQLWTDGEHTDQKNYPEAKDCKFYAEWASNPPNVELYNPNTWTKEEAICYQMYETVTEGTPVSPVFDNLKGLEDWLVTAQGYDRETAEEFCQTGSAVTFEGYLPRNSPLLKLETRKPATEKKEKRNRPKR